MFNILGENTAKLDKKRDLGVRFETVFSKTLSLSASTSYNEYICAQFHVCRILVLEKLRLVNEYLACISIDKQMCCFDSKGI